MAEPAAGPPRRPTIRDVAERAGVSKSLVSLVMRGEPLVRDDKRRRVRQAAAELGYRTNWAARSLSAVRSGTVGVLAAERRGRLGGLHAGQLRGGPGPARLQPGLDRAEAGEPGRLAQRREPAGAEVDRVELELEGGPVLVGRAGS